MGAFFFSMFFIVMLVVIGGVYNFLPEEWREWIES